MTSYLLTFAEGILTFISPCILPMLPVYFIYLAGAPEDHKGDGSSKTGNRILLNSIAFVIGFTIVFVLLGATVTAIGQLLESNRSLLQKVSGIIMVIFGLNFAGILKIKFLNMEKRIQHSFGYLNFFSSILFGMIFAFGWTPCLGAFLGSALLLAGSSGTLSQGILLLLTYSIGLGIPFIIFALIFEKIKDTFAKIQKYNKQISLISGILLIIAGILVFTDTLKYLI